MRASRSDPPPVAAVEVGRIVAWPTRVLATLIEPHAFDLLRIPHLGEAARRRGLDGRRLLMRDVSAPGKAFEAKWPAESAA